ncbi:MAG: hypothetical protein M3R04_05460, partial [bacterium]|nr:hypothetical protein [bacterium]
MFNPPPSPGNILVPAPTPPALYSFTDNFTDGDFVGWGGRSWNLAWVEVSNDAVLSVVVNKLRVTSFTVATTEYGSSPYARQTIGPLVIGKTYNVVIDYTSGSAASLPYIDCVGATKIILLPVAAGISGTLTTSFVATDVSPYLILGNNAYDVSSYVDYDNISVTQVGVASGATDTTPAPFSFTANPSATASAVTTSNTVTPTGFDATTTASVTGGTISINGGTYGTGGPFNPGDTVTARGTASATAGAVVNVVATIGGQAATFAITTVVASAAFDGPAELPRSVPTIDSLSGMSFANTYTVISGSFSDLQATVNTAAALAGSGNILINVPVATYTVTPSEQGLLLPARSGGGTGWIVIRSMGTLPAEGTRVTTANSAQLAKLSLTSPQPGYCAVTAAEGTHHYRLVGLEIYTTTASTWKISELTRFGLTTKDQSANPSHSFIVDRCYLHGPGYTQMASTGGNMNRAISIHCNNMAVIECCIRDIYSQGGSDCQAIWLLNGGGPILIRNNYLEASTENFMIGGGGLWTRNLVPHDITFVRNHLYKNPAWYDVRTTHPWSIKNLFELKLGLRVLVEGNVMQNQWDQGQSQYAAVVLKTVDQDGTTPWAICADVTFRYNKISVSPMFMTIGAAPEAYMHSVREQNAA